MKNIKVIINGICGRMGKTILSVSEETNNLQIVAGVDKFATAPFTGNIPVYTSLEDVKESADVIVDFSAKEALQGILDYSIKKQIPTVLCTTGYSSTDIAAIEAASKSVAVFRSANMSLGVNILMKLVEQATKYTVGLADIEITETHHNQKKDAPSGTALMLFESAKAARPALTPVCGREGQVGARTPDEVGIHAIRGGTVVGKHDVSFFMGNEVITLHHEAESRTVFARGALQAALFLAGKPAGLYSMSDLLA